MKKNSGFESGFMEEVGFMQKRCTKTAAVRMYYGTSESLNIKQAFGRG
jgi:hypothetical protein